TTTTGGLCPPAMSRHKQRGPSACTHLRNAEIPGIASSLDRKCRASAETTHGRRATDRFHFPNPRRRWQSHQSHRLKALPPEETTNRETPTPDARSDAPHAQNGR